MIGTPTPIRPRRSLMCGTAAAASSRSTVMRTISEPARASAATCAVVAAMSAVSVLVIDCTTIGASPPTVTPPTSTATDRRLFSGAAWLILVSFLPLLQRLSATGFLYISLLEQTQCQTGRAPSTWGRAPTLTAMGADAADFDHRRFRREAGRPRRRAQRGCNRYRGGLAHGPATLADQEHDRFCAGVVVDAGHEGIAALDAMDEAVVAQEFKRP